MAENLGLTKIVQLRQVGVEVLAIFELRGANVAAVESNRRDVFRLSVPVQFHVGSKLFLACCALEQHPVLGGGRRCNRRRLLKKLQCVHMALHVTQHA